MSVNPKAGFGRVITMSAGKALRMTQEAIDANPEDCYLITFSSKLKSYALERGWNYCPNLAPGTNLFNRMQELKSGLTYNQSKVFHEYYTPKFLEELTHTPALLSLSEIRNKLIKGKNVLLVCFCGEEDVCHRGIIKRVLEDSLPDII